MLENPRIVSLSAPALELLDLDANQVKEDPDAADYLVGNKVMPGAEVMYRWIDR